LKTLEPACQPTRLTLELDDPKETVQNHKTDEQNNAIKWKPLKYCKKLYSIIILDNNGKDIMQIYNDDIVKIDDKEYRIYMSSDLCIDYINKYYNVSFVKLKDLETNIGTKITKQEFMDIFKNNNVTYVISRLINWLNGNKFKKN
jgi:ribonucleotide monophosphatase NagD (HAD superfamily)